MTALATASIFITHQQQHLNFHTTCMHDLRRKKKLRRPPRHETKRIIRYCCINKNARHRENRPYRWILDLLFTRHLQHNDQNGGKQIVDSSQASPRARSSADLRKHNNINTRQHDEKSPRRQKFEFVRHARHWLPNTHPNPPTPTTQESPYGRQPSSPAPHGLRNTPPI